MYRCFFPLLFLSLSCHHQSPEKNLSLIEHAPLAKRLEIAPSDLDVLQKQYPQTFNRIKERIPLKIIDVHLLLEEKFSEQAIIACLSYTKSHFSLSTRDIIDILLSGENELLLNYLLRTRL